MQIQNKNNYSQPYLLLSTRIKILCYKEWHCFLEEGNPGLGQVFSCRMLQYEDTVWLQGPAETHINWRSYGTTVHAGTTDHSELWIQISLHFWPDKRVPDDSRQPSLHRAQTHERGGLIAAVMFLAQGRINAPDLCFAFSWFTPNGLPWKLLLWLISFPLAGETT